MKRAACFLIFGAITVLMMKTVHAGAFAIGTPDKVKAGEQISIVVYNDENKASKVELSITSRQDTESYELAMKDGRATLDHTFVNPGSYILRAVDSADKKNNHASTTKSLRVQPVGGLK